MQVQPESDEFSTGNYEVTEMLLHFAAHLAGKGSPQKSHKFAVSQFVQKDMNFF
jgi:hypothetical protein